MPMPRWWARMNRWTFNPRELKKGVRPVLIHVGRTSGREYRTPLDAVEVDGGYLFVPVYGVNSDWVLNTLAAGTARVQIRGVDISLTNPRLIAVADAAPLLPEGSPQPPGWMKIEQYLLTDTVSPAA